MTAETVVFSSVARATAASHSGSSTRTERERRGPDPLGRRSARLLITVFPSLVGYWLRATIVSRTHLR